MSSTPPSRSPLFYGGPTLSAGPAAPPTSTQFKQAGLNRRICTMFVPELGRQLLGSISLVNDYSFFFAVLNIDINEQQRQVDVLPPLGLC